MIEQFFCKLGTKRLMKDSTLIIVVLKEPESHIKALKLTEYFEYNTVRSGFFRNKKVLDQHTLLCAILMHLECENVMP